MSLYVYIMSTKSIRKNIPNRPQGIGNPKNWDVFEGKNVREQMKKAEVKIGDTITMVTFNQKGYKKYEVVPNEKGKKDLLMIDSYYIQISRSDNEDTVGGKNRSKKNRSKKNRTRRNKHKK